MNFSTQSQAAAKHIEDEKKINQFSAIPNDSSSQRPNELIVDDTRLVEDEYSIIPVKQANLSKVSSKSKSHNFKSKSKKNGSSY